MKKALVLFVIGTMILACQKEDTKEPSTIKQDDMEVSIDLALKVAQNFAFDNSFSSIGEEKSSTEPVLRTFDYQSEIEIKETTIVSCEDKNPAYYIVNLEPEGWVIVSANKKAPPVIAYSKLGSFNIESVDDMQSGVILWLNESRDHIQSLRNNSLTEINDDLQKSWDGSAPPDDDDEIIISGGTVYEQKGPFLTTTWSQGEGYNDYAPWGDCYGRGTPDNGRKWTGCVATAAAQIMNYWEHPNTYSWQLMPDSYGSASVSELMDDIGEEVNMSYGCYGSSASTSSLKSAFKNDFGYSNDIDYVTASTFVIREQLNNSSPVIMRGDDGGATGHAWVCDGYKRTVIISIHNPGTYYEYETSVISNPLYHMNWGWGGFYNGWFNYFDLDPQSNGGYDDDKKLLINIYP